MKEKELAFSDIPRNFLWCINRQCPKAATCLRQLAERLSPVTLVSCETINPNHLTGPADGCPYFRSNKQVRYARGFLGILENLTTRQKRFFSSRIINNSSRRTYYRIRNGERALSPDEQQNIINVLKECGVTFAIEFDAYFEDYDWGSTL
ncbi:hypothetical protein DWX40_11670 [Bacteroides stercoris]|uniref:Uncharacterized protein n=1 Tax=Bacteroides stercoris TaxID=46506 RepID=A0A414L2J1_BACSE|nr:MULTISPECIES: DUF6078 family protein [Bacteroides]KAB5260381.1 hypothetical protein F9968_14380 [Bacteroides stercoris]KAB5260424.1 hypothetical protein F9966_13790 [Bacteroides stercoris]KAB5274858.1 hypothetical protein F9964_17630 [Bacteroides stercoris]KAB5279955.1 hypothetical protein F9962_14340 [Bacteroides stercoris]KAB5283776.1 hypothetical protein F9957_12330 [Bacteroides stercoris]